ncbi:MAG: SctD/MshK family protein [Salinarimonas sp.]
MLAALKNRLKPGPDPPDNGNAPGILPDDLPDAERVEAELRAAAATATPREGDFRIIVSDRGAPCFEDRFDAGEIVVGADPECDVVITDIDAPEVLVIRLERIGSAGMITLTALCNGVTARERELPVGRPVQFPDRAQFSIASDYAFSVDLAPRRQKLAKAPSGPAVLLTGALLLALAGWLLSAPLPRPDPPAPLPTPPPQAERVAPDLSEAPAPSQPARLRSVTPTPPADPAPAGEPDAPGDLADAARRLRARLLDANLVPPLVVAPEADGILVSGALSPGERERAIDVMQAFREGASVSVTMKITAEPRENPFFTAVVLRPETFAIGADGQRYREGQRLPDGGRIEKIDENAIVVNRDGLLERVSYAW